LERVNVLLTKVNGHIEALQQRLADSDQARKWSTQSDAGRRGRGVPPEQGPEDFVGVNVSDPFFVDEMTRLVLQRQLRDPRALQRLGERVDALKARNEREFIYRDGRFKFRSTSTRLSVF